MDHNFNYNSRHTTSRDQSSGLLSSPLPFALALLGGGAAIFGLWYFYYAGSQTPSNQPLPIVKADAGPMKVKPDNSAQPEVPHQDKLVYGRVNPSEQGSGVERLLPPTEEPVDMAMNETSPSDSSDEGFPNPHIKAEDKSEFRSDPIDSRPTKVETKSPAPKTENLQPVIETDFPMGKLPGALTQEQREVEETVNPMDSKTPVAETTTSLAGSVSPTQANEKSILAKTLQSGYRVQLASLKSQDQAKDEWRRLQAEHKGTLSGLNATFARVDLGAKKGIFYRVQAGDFASKADAQNVCTKLKNNNPSAGCFIVKF